jgi:uncharacterized membrane protein YuzA (DUF378 family)
MVYTVCRTLALEQTLDNREVVEHTLDRPWTWKYRGANPIDGRDHTTMRMLKSVALLLTIVGSVNWLLVGIARFDLVATLTGDSFGETNPISSVIYILVGISGIAPAADPGGVAHRRRALGRRHAVSAAAYNDDRGGQHVRPVVLFMGLTGG